MIAYDKDGRPYEIQMDDMSIGFKKNGQGIITIMSNDEKKTFSFLAENKEDFLKAMNNVWNVTR